MDFQFLSMNQLYELTGIDRRTIKKRLKPLAPSKEDGRAGYYETKEALKLLYPTVSTEMAQESLLLERARRKKMDIEVAKLSGELIPVEVVAKEIEREYAIVRTQFRSLPTKLAKALAITTDPAEVEKKLTEAIDESLNELSADAKYQSEQLSAKSISAEIASDESDGVEANSEAEPG